MPVVPNGFVHLGQLDEEIQKAIRKLGPEVINVTYQLRPDSTGEPAIFFRIVLTDVAAQEDVLLESTRRIETMLIDEIQPIENWGRHPFFNYSTRPEQQRRKNLEWA